MKTIRSFAILVGLLLSFSLQGWAQESIQGTYKAVLQHEEGGYHQLATVTLRTVNTGDGNLKISANVRLFFGDWNSSEFLVYEYPDCPMNILTRQISLKNDNSDVSFIGYLKSGTLSGEWYSPAVGRVGAFSAMKAQQPPVPPDTKLVKTITGHYIGAISNTNPASNLPEKVTMSLVTTQDPGAIGTNIKITGNMRFYLGDFGSSEYVETKLSSVEFNFYSRYLTAKTEQYGVSLKGNVSLDGVFKGEVFADGLGLVGTIEVGTK